MDILQSFLLGLIQGLTEFLPISSSGHLALGRYLLGSDTEMGITFEVVVHFGTLCSIIIYYKTEILNLFLAVLKFLRAPKVHKDDVEIKTIGFILISMILTSLQYLYLIIKVFWIYLLLINFHGI